MAKVTEEMKNGPKTKAADSPAADSPAADSPAADSPAADSPAAAPPAIVNIEIVAGAPTSGIILVANQHTGPIILPRKSRDGVAVNPLILGAGTVTPVDAQEWEIRKQNKVVQYYLDKRLLAEVTSTGPVPVLDNTSTDLDAALPDILKQNEQSGATTPAGTTLTSSVKESGRVGEVPV